MKCSKCGKEIASDSNFCEYCGTKVQTSKSKKSFGLVLPILLALCISLIILDVFYGEFFGKQTRYEEAMCDTTETDSIEFVDLGLSSGTLWKNVNEDGFYPYDEALNYYGDNLPTEGQWEELINECSWTWTGEGYDVTGNNGNSIFLPAAGCRNVKGELCRVGADGEYWSFTSNDSEWPQGLTFDSDGVGKAGYESGLAISVRIVQK